MLNLTEEEGFVSLCYVHASLGEKVDKLKNEAITNYMKFNKSKCQILHLGRDNPDCTYRLENEMQKSSPAEGDLGVLSDSQLNTNQQ